MRFTDDELSRIQAAPAAIFLLVAGAIFLVIKALNSAKAKFDTAVTAAPPPPPEDVVLLREIRDALAKR